MAELLPWLNLCLPPLLIYVIRIENRLTRLEVLREADQQHARSRARVAA